VVSQFATLPMFIFCSVKSGVFDLRREVWLLPTVLFGMGAGKLIALVG
jgi:hypothetical protein